MIRLLGQRSTLESLADYFLGRGRGFAEDRGSLSDKIAEWEIESHSDDVDGDIFRSVESTLHQHHLPSLEDAGVIEYDRDEIQVLPEEELADYFPFVEERPSPNSVFPGSARYGDVSDLTVDMGFNVLQNERRREVIRYLEGIEDVVSVGELSDHLAAEFSEHERVDFNHSERKNQYVGLVQVHLPRLDELDVVDYDGDRKKVGEGPYLELLSDYLPEEENTEYSIRNTRSVSPVSLP